MFAESTFAVGVQLSYTPVRGDDTDTQSCWSSPAKRCELEGRIAAQLPPALGHFARSLSCQRFAWLVSVALDAACRGTPRHPRLPEQIQSLGGQSPFTGDAVVVRVRGSVCGIQSRALPVTYMVATPATMRPQFNANPLPIHSMLF